MIFGLICNGKESSQEYLDIHRSAHEIGLPSNCTMLFGTIESTRQRVQHMLQLRDLAFKRMASNVLFRIHFYLILHAFQWRNYRLAKKS